MSSQIVRWTTLAACALAASAALGSDFRLEKRFDLAAAGSFSLHAEGGGVTVRGVAGRQAAIVVTSSRSDFADYYDVRFEPAGDRLDVRIERRSHGLRWGNFGSIHVDVELPRDVAAAEVESSGGSVEVSDLAGRLRADSSGGSVRIADIGGDVILRSSGGGVNVQGVGGSARVESSGGSLTLRSVAGDIDASSSGGGVRIEEAGGEVVAGSSGGPVRVSFAAGNAHGGDLHSSGGGVHVELDPAVGLDIDASSSGGGVRCEVPVTIRGRVSRGRLTGKLNAGGSLLKLRSSGGGITIEER